jgi:hypothetical protein
MSSLNKFLMAIVKPLVVAKLSHIASDITPEDIEAKLDLDGFFHKLESDPKYAELAPFLAQLEAQGEEAQKQIALLLDAVLDLLVVYVAEKL